MTLKKILLVLTTLGLLAASSDAAAAFCWNPISGWGCADDGDKKP